MKKIFSIFVAILLLCGLVGADWIYNPFTGHLDYYESGSAATFLSLTDTPANYTGSSTYYLRVKADLSGIEFVALDKSSVGLGNVENTALSTWAGTTNITTLGTIATGAWNGTAIPTVYGGTGTDSSGWTGVVYTSGGNWFNEAQLGIARGGTGINSSAAQDGSLLIGHTLPAQGFSLGTLTGTANQITVTNGASSITLSTPQDIGTSSDVQFGSVTSNVIDGTAETTATPSAGFTVDWSSNQYQRVTITGTDLDVTFTNPAGPCKLVLVVVQGDGDDTIDWSNEADIKWPGGVAPTLSTGSGDVDLVTFYFDGTSYFGTANYDYQ